MATVEEFVVRVLGFLLYWFYIIIFICIIVKFVQMLWGIGSGIMGKGGGGKDGKPKGKKASDETDPNGNSPGYDKGDPAPGKVDHKNPGKFQVKVTNKNGTPIADVKIKLTPANRRTRELFKFWSRKIGWVKLEGKTNVNGVWPDNPESIASGWWQVSIDAPAKYLFELASSLTELPPKPLGYRKKGAHYIEAGQENLIHIQLVTKDEAVRGFEPFILDVREEDDRLVLKGVIR